MWVSKQLLVPIYFHIIETKNTMIVCGYQQLFNISSVFSRRKKLRQVCNNMTWWRVNDDMNYTFKTYRSVHITHFTFSNDSFPSLLSDQSSFLIALWQLPTDAPQKSSVSGHNSRLQSEHAVSASRREYLFPVYHLIHWHVLALAMV